MSLIFVLVAVSTAGCWTQQAGGPDDEAIALNNRGVGFMGRFDYESAHAAFEQVVAANPEWTDARINLAIAVLNRQQEGDETAALAMVEQVLLAEPDNLRAHYIAALLKLNAGETLAAAEHFATVAQRDPADAYAAYYYGQALMQQGSVEEALAWYQRAREADPYLRSAYYGEFMARQRLRDREGAAKALEGYQRLADNPRAGLAEIKYTRMGAKADALAVGTSDTPAAALPEGPLFAEPVELRTFHTPEMKPARGLSVAQPMGTPLVFINERDASTALDSETWEPASLAFAVTPGIRAVAWGDFDNDGLVDVYLARQGPNELWRQTAPGVWKDVTADAGVSGGELQSSDALFVDADHDGDLDILVANSDGPLELFNNNLDGSFRTLAAGQGLAGHPATGLAAADLDADRDLDLVVLHEETPHEVFINDRLWAYRPGTGFEDFLNTPAHAVTVGDADADGQVELYTLSGTQLQRWQPDETGRWASTTLLGDKTGRQLALADVNGDGTPEILMHHDAGWLVADVHSGQISYESSSVLEGWALFNADAGGGPAVLGFASDQKLLMWPPGTGRHGFMAVSFSGREDEGESMRSNASGIGAHAALRVGTEWSVISTLRHDSGPGQSLQPVLIGLGGAGAADYIAIDWSDGVFQTELDLQAGELHAITETQRQLASCPVLFVWDGESYAFVSDLLGVGGIGFNVGAGVYANPRPWENFQLPDGVLKARNGRFHLKITEPMEEVAYLDAARLIAWDVPEVWDMVLDERLGTGAPTPSGEPRWFTRQILPVRAVNERGEDVTVAVRATDHIAASVGMRDSRFPGLLAGEHRLVLEFDTALSDGPGEPLLIMEGWVEYGYSQTGFAAWQAGVGYEPPTLEYRDAAGHWQVLHERFGYPAGMPRRASVSLDGLPAGTRALRLRSNQEIYWDRLAVAWAEEPERLERRELALEKARVNKPGFPRRSKLAQRRPDYDYGARVPFWDTRYAEGFYTALGPATELVASTDSALAIIGPGEEIHLEFTAPARAPAPGWKRIYVLETNGWAKDMDLYTRDGETVGPLPSAGHDPALRAELHARYNSRFQAGR